MIFMAQSLVAIDERVAQLTWAKNLDGTVKAYNIYQKVNNGTLEKIDTVTGETWTSPPLRHDSEYTFYVTSTNTSNIESAMVNPIKFKLAYANVNPFVEPYRQKELVLTSGAIHSIDLTEYNKNVMINFEVEL